MLGVYCLVIWVNFVKFKLFLMLELIIIFIFCEWVCWMSEMYFLSEFVNVGLIIIVVKLGLFFIKKWGLCIFLFYVIWMFVIFVNWWERVGVW